MEDLSLNVLKCQHCDESRPKIISIHHEEQIRWCIYCAKCLRCTGVRQSVIAAVVDHNKHIRSETK